MKDRTVQIRPLNAELQKKAKELLNEVPERIPEDLEALKTWIAQQPYLNARTNDQFLLAFLRGCKYSLEKAKYKIDKYYTLRTKFPEIFNKTDVDDPLFREILRLGIQIPVPTPPNYNGPQIVIMRNGIYPANKYPMQLLFSVGQVLQEICMLENDNAIINGVVFIMDMEGATAAHFFQMQPSMMKKITVFSEEAMPLRPKALHFMNSFSAMEPFFNLMKPMMPKKIQDRLYVHGTKWDLLYKEVPQKYLPKEYGGEIGTITDIIAAWEKKVDEYREHFKENATYGTDETLRPGQPVDFDSFFGIEGSFRKLNVD